MFINHFFSKQNEKATQLTLSITFRGPARGGTYFSSTIDAHPARHWGIGLPWTTYITIHLGRWIVYSVTFSGNLEGYFRSCSELFRRDVGRLLEQKWRGNRENQNHIRWYQIVYLATRVCAPPPSHLQGSSAWTLAALGGAAYRKVDISYGKPVPPCPAGWVPLFSVRLKPTNQSNPMNLLVNNRI